jgi:hypothetical protein
MEASKMTTIVGTHIDQDGILTLLIKGRARLYIFGHEDKTGLTLETEDQSAGVSIDDPDKEPGRRHKYRACFGLERDGTFAGFYIDEQTNIHHFRGPAKGHSQAAARAAGKPWRPPTAPRKRKNTGQQPTTDALAAKTKATPRTKKTS